MYEQLKDIITSTNWPKNAGLYSCLYTNITQIRLQEELSEHKWYLSQTCDLLCAGPSDSSMQIHIIQSLLP